MSAPRGSFSCDKDIRPLVRRNLLGVIALGMLGLAAIAGFYPPLAEYQAAGKIMLRIGILLVVFWLAWPDIDRLPRWFWFALPIILVMMIYARGALIYAAPLLAAATAIFLLYRRLRGP
jgi:hypothetical protein